MVNVTGAARSIDTSSKAAKPADTSDQAKGATGKSSDASRDAAPIGDAKQGARSLSDHASAKGPSSGKGHVDTAPGKSGSRASHTESSAKGGVKDASSKDDEAASATAPKATAAPTAGTRPDDNAGDAVTTKGASKASVTAQVERMVLAANSSGNAAMIPPVGEGGITSPYGEREPASSLNLLPNGKEMHFGIDYARPEGTPIKAAADGKVVVAGWNVYGAGNEVVIDHGVDDQGQHVYSRYMHQSGLAASVGATVRQGDTIGFVGQTGAAFGSHLHFQVSHDNYGSNVGAVDPNPYLTGARSFPGHAGAAPAKPAPAAPVEDKPGAGATYTVQPGDTIGVIATRLGISAQDLINANRATMPNPNLIFPGQQLQLGGKAAPAAAPAPAAKGPAASSYTVQAGDTMGAIATRLGVSLDNLASANRATVPNPNLIQPGQKLQVPGAAGAEAAPAAKPAAAVVPKGVGASRPEVDAFIVKAGKTYNVNAGVLSRMAQLESDYNTGDVANSWDINALVNGTPSKGMFQFIEPTFNTMAPAARAANPAAWEGLGDLNWTDWRQQALTTAWAVAHGQGHQWSTFFEAGGR